MRPLPDPQEIMPFPPPKLGPKERPKHHPTGPFIRDAFADVKALECFRLWAAERMMFKDIAPLVGLDQSTVSRYCHGVRDALMTHKPDEWRTEMIMRAEVRRMELRENIHNPPPKVDAKGSVVIDPRTGEPVPDGLVRNADRREDRLNDEHLAKVLGLIKPVMTIKEVRLHSELDEQIGALEAELRAKIEREAYERGRKDALAEAGAEPADVVEAEVVGEPAGELQGSAPAVPSPAGAEGREAGAAGQVAGKQALLEEPGQLQEEPGAPEAGAPAG